MRKQEHNYEVYELKHGFKIVPKDETRPPVTYTLDNRGFWHKKTKEQQWGFSGIPLYSYYPLLDEAVDELYKTWKPEKRNSGNNYFKDMVITKYCKRTTGKTLNKVIHAIWVKKRDALDPKIVELHRKLFSVSKGTGDWSRVDYVISHKRSFKYLIDDMIKYPAARIAILHFYGGDMHELYRDWKYAYACGDETYTSLNKTLMNLPNGVSYYNVLTLKQVRLPEPITSRIRMYAYAMIIRSRAAFVHASRDKLIEVIVRSSDEDIKKAIRYMWGYFPSTYTGDFRKVKGIEHALTLMFDYPADMIGDWDIMGLCKRSELYQHDLELQEQMRQREYELQRAEWEKRNKEEREKWELQQKLLRSSQTALPPIKLPDLEDVEFLDSYKRVVEEGKNMGHCIASYAESAVKGGCYLFHINYKDETASVEVNPQGFVNQSYGPRDSTNMASEYGRKVLGDWAKKLVGKGLPTQRWAKEQNLEIEQAVMEDLGYVEIPF